MPTAQVEKVFEAARRLAPEDFGQFSDRVLELRTQQEAPRRAPHLLSEESALLLINRGLPQDERCRFDELMHKRLNEDLSDEENREFVRLAEKGEELNAQRVAALYDLA